MSKRSSVRVWVCAVLGILFLGMLIVGIDLLLTHGKTARGATVAGLDAGNLTPTQSSEVLDQLAARAAKLVILVTPKGETRIDPKELGLSFDAAATLERLRQQLIDPFRRIGGLLGSETHIDPVITVNRRTPRRHSRRPSQATELSAVEGGVRFDQGRKPVADMPTAGQRIARGGLPQVLRESWLRGRPITMPTEEFSPTVSAETVRITHDGPATTAMAGPIVLNGRDGAKPSISPAELGEVLPSSWQTAGADCRRSSITRPRSGLSARLWRARCVSPSKQRSRCRAAGRRWWRPRTVPASTGPRHSP